MHRDLLKTADTQVVKMGPAGVEQRSLVSLISWTLVVRLYPPTLLFKFLWYTANAPIGGFLWAIHNYNNVQRKATTDFDGKFIDTVKRLDSQIVESDRPVITLYSANNLNAARSDSVNPVNQTLFRSAASESQTCFRITDSACRLQLHHSKLILLQGKRHRTPCVSVNS